MTGSAPDLDAARRLLGFCDASPSPYHACATTAAVLLSHALRFAYSYWMAIATVLVLQPSVATTWPRALERAVGSVLGGALAALLGLVLHTPLAITAAVFPLAIATMAVRSVNYGLFVFFLTPLFVLARAWMIDPAAPGPVEAVGAATGALAGSFTHVGIDEDFIKSVREKITPGTSALFVMTSDAVVDKVKDAFPGADAELIHTNLSDADEAKLREAFAEED